MSWIFVHVPRTGGTSISRVLRDHFGPGMKRGNARLRHGHARAVDHIAEMGEDAWRDTYTFAVLRHPADRLVSVYHYAISWSGRPGSIAGFRAWVQAGQPLSVLPHQLQVTGTTSIWIDAPQADWICDDQGRCLVRRLVLFEQLQYEWGAVLRGKLDRTLPSQLPTLNASRGRVGWEQYYNEDVYERMRTKYARDYVLGGWHR